MRAADEAPVRREADPIEAAERGAMAGHHAALPDACPWRPGAPGPLRDGLLAGWRASRSARLAGLAERLEAARPRRTWGVRELDWRAWQGAAREAAGLPSAEWAAWRATVGTDVTIWKPSCAACPATGEARR